MGYCDFQNGSKNFDPKQHSNLLTHDIKTHFRPKSTNWSEIQQNIEKVLNNITMFSTSFDEQGLNEFINLFIKDIEKQIERINKRRKPDEQLKFNENLKQEVNDFLKQRLSQESQIISEHQVNAVIPGSTDLISEDEKYSMTYEATVKSIYNQNQLLNNFRQEIFNDKFIELGIIKVPTNHERRNGKEGYIVDSIHAFNQAIEDYQKDQYSIIYRYLKSKGYTGLSNNFYSNHSRVNTVQKTLDLMYSEIQRLKQDENFNYDSVLENDWVQEISGTKSKNITLFQAVNAYMNLVHFDQCLFNCFGKYLKINNNQVEPIVKNNTVSENDNSYKYSFNSGNENSVKHWGMENRDALKEMSKFQKILISCIPNYSFDIDSHTNSQLQPGHLSPKELLGAITKLLDVGALVTIANSDGVWENTIQLYTSDPGKYIEIIFKELFEKSSNKSLLNKLNELGFDKNYLNILYSFYRTVFKGDNSWKAIEANYIRENGLTNRYFLIDTLLGVTSSNTSMNYLETKYDYLTNSEVTSVKSRYSANKYLFDIINNTNNRTLNRINKAELLTQYEIKRNNLKTSITLNKSISFDIKPNKNDDLLDKISANKFTISGLDDLFKTHPETKQLTSKLKIDISKNNRKRLIDKQELSNEENKFMGILEFIDEMLGTRFSKSEDGLEELNLLLSVQSMNFKNLIVAASRALLVTDIYNQFNNAKVPNTETSYSITELKKFLSDYKNVYSTDFSSIEDKKKLKQYFKMRDNGEHLIVLHASESWISDLAKIRAQLSGDTTKSVISNLEGKKIPNFGPGFLGMNINQQINDANKDFDSAAGALLFADGNKTSAIQAKVINTDVVTKYGIKKQIKSMSVSELVYDSIVNKFMIPYLDNKTVYTQPTTYADKTKYITYQIGLTTLGLTEINKSDFNSKVEKLIGDTIGEAYRRVYNVVLSDYKVLFEDEIKNLINPDGTINLDKIQDWMRNHTKDDLNKLGAAKGITILEELHYRQLKKNLSINELLYDYANNLYKVNSENGLYEALHKRLEQEKINFINELTDCCAEFNLSFVGNDLDSNGNAITKFLLQFFPDQNSALQWVTGTQMILAKVKGKDGKIRNIVYGNVELQPGEIFIINPVLNAYFMLDNLIGNNLRLSLTASELNHKVKALASLDIRKSNPELTEFIKNNNPYYSEDSAITLYELQRAIQNSTNPNEEELKKYAQQIYDAEIYKLENAEQLAQFKRNVPIPGTIRQYLLQRLNGIKGTMKVAVIEDVQAQVFNFDGKSDKTDAHDGAAFMNPFTSILENFSLQDSEVGTVKKPLLHSYDNKYMSATLLKYAVDTITNKWMLQSEGNNINQENKGITLRDVFKKMTNVRWHDEQGNWKFGPIDLLRCDFINDEKGINFGSIILKNKPLYYQNSPNDSRIIEDFGKDVDENDPRNIAYYTIEAKVDNTGNIRNEEEESEKIYHYFDEDGQHFKLNRILSLEEQLESKLHTIDSLFELHTAIGGIYSQSLDEEGYLQYSEASNEAVVQFINHVAILKENGDENDLTQNSYYQPLKEAMIDVLANKTAMKNGAGNVNSVSAFYDKSDLLYIKVKTNSYGVQQDSDHEADEATMTEFSQVISSLDAGGRLHDYVSQIYDMLGQLALDLTQVELDAVKEFRETQNITAIYDVIGRTMIAHFSQNKGMAGLADAIISKISEKFNLNTDHVSDVFKIPFSDPNIYSQILSTFVSAINNKAIKRKYPGLGTVMVPGYNMSMIYEIDGKKYIYEDILNQAFNEFSNLLQGKIENSIEDEQFKNTITNISDITMRNRMIVQWYLNKKQAKVPWETTTEKFQPTDNVRIECDELFNIDALNKDEVEWEIVDKPWKNDATKSNKTLRIYIKDKKHLGYFELVKDYEYGYYSVHFKTGDPNTGSTKQITVEVNGKKKKIYGSNKKHREILYKQILNALPNGALLSTWGEVSEGGVKALKKLESLGNLEQVGQRTVADRNNNNLIIPIYKKAGEYNITKIKTVRLDSISDYYMFKNNVSKFLGAENNYENIRYQKNISVPRNLAPTKITWKYDEIVTVNGEETTITHDRNIFDHWRVKGLFQEIDEIQNSNLNGFKKKQKVLEARKKWNVQKAFDDLANDIYYENEEAEINNISYSVYHEGENGERIDGVDNAAAELIVSNIYKSKFKVKDSETLASVLQEGSNHFMKEIKTINSNNYDLAYINGNNKHLYITFKPIQNDTVDSTKRLWDNVIRKEYEYPKDYKGDKKIINRLYCATKDNVPLFEIGREVIAKNVIYDEESGKFKSKDTKKVLPAQYKYRRYKGDKVLKRIDFITNYQIVEKHKKYTLYNINKKNIKDVLYQREYSEKELEDVQIGDTTELSPEEIKEKKIESKFNSEANDFIANLLKNIYHSSDFGGIQVNTSVSLQSHNILKGTLNKLADKLKYNQDLYAYLNSVSKVVKNGNIDKNNVTYNERKLNYNLKRYSTMLKEKQYTSFRRSLYFTASRIPAQTLQSFMQMETVAFAGVSSNQCFVSHWQTWLQGSDYDIDKAYLMGLSFDDNGTYVGWSTLFDYSSLSTLKASEYLPMPKKKVYKLNNTTGLDIGKYVNDIIESEKAGNRVKKINTYVKLLNYLHKNNITDIKSTSDFADKEAIKEVFHKIQEHEFTKIPYNLQEDASKNFISSHIQNTVQNIRNMIAAYSPIEMEDFRAASENSPKGSQSQKYTLFNPATKFVMQFQNMTGKNVIGIAANGEKASFMWHYYINDVIREVNDVLPNTDSYQSDLNKEIAKLNLLDSSKVFNNIEVKKYLLDTNYYQDVNKTFEEHLSKMPTLQKLKAIGQKVKYSKFNFTTNRILGRSINDIHSITTNTLPDVQFEGINEELMRSYGVKLTGNVVVDLMISQVLSAATDNAKELILAKVNAGSKLAKIYLFLITMGYDINDIVSFMTSPVVSFIDTLSETNIFSNIEINLNEAIMIASGDFSFIPYKFFKNGRLSLSTESFNNLKKGEIPSKNPYSEGTYDYRKFEDMCNFIMKIHDLKKRNINIDIKEKIKNGLSEDEAKKQADNEFKEDLAEFKNVLEGADEFSNLGKFLGLNQGLPTSQEELQKRIGSIQKILSSRIKAYNKTVSEDQQIEDTPLDVKRYLKDPEYAQSIKELYERVKKCVNVFEVLDQIPQYRSILDIFSGILDIHHYLPIKSRAFNKVYDQLKKQGIYLPEDFQKRMLKSIDNAIISKFLIRSNLKIIYPEKSSLINIARQEEISKEGGILRFNDIADIASFKNIFENVIIPALQKGIIYEYDSENQKVVETSVDNLKDNKFITSLLETDEREMPIYKCDLDMLLTDSTISNKIKFYKYTKGLHELAKIPVNGGMKISDMFVLYNLIVHKNNYGSDRMTKLFESFIGNHGELSLLSKYFHWLGDMDYNGNAENLNLNINEVLITAAKIVNSSYGQQDPVIILNTEKGPEAFQKEGYKYVPFPVDIVPELKSEKTVDEKLKRLSINKKYFTLGGIFDSDIKNKIQNIRKITPNMLSVLTDLSMKGILIIEKVCE